MSQSRAPTEADVIRPDSVRGRVLLALVAGGADVAALVAEARQPLDVVARACVDLEGRGFVTVDGGVWSLTSDGRACARVVRMCVGASK